MGVLISIKRPIFFIPKICFMTDSKRILTLMIAGCLISSGLVAQDQTVSKLKSEASRKNYEDTSYKYNARGWRKGGIFSLNLAQGSSSNWAAGAEKSSFSVAGYTTLFANKKRAIFSGIIPWTWGTPCKKPVPWGPGKPTIKLTSTARQEKS